MNLEKGNKEKGKYIWVIKDNSGLFAHDESIGQVDNANDWLYIGFRTFSEECRGYLTRWQAEKALLKLNKIKSQAILPVTFVLKYMSLQRLIKENKEFLGENMVVFEKKSSVVSLTPAI